MLDLVQLSLVHGTEPPLRPILRLFLVIMVNGLVSMGVAAIFIELEGPAQQERYECTTGETMFC